MEFFNIGKYQDGNYGPPDHFIDPKKKDKIWHIGMAQYIYMSYLNDLCAIPYSQGLEIEIARLYGEGNQPVTKYMDWICPEDELGKRRSFSNISWDIVSPVPLLREKFVDMCEKFSFDCEANAIDENSASAKQQKKWDLWSESQLKPYMDEIYAIGGISPPPPPPQMPKSLQELQMLDQGGSFKLAEEEGYEQLVEYTQHLSQFPEVRRRIFKDFFDTGYGVCRDVVDPETQKIVVQYIDPEAYMTEMTRFSDNKSSEYDAHVELYNFADLVQAANGQISIEELQNTVERYQGWCGNPMINQLEYTYYYDARVYNYNNFKVPVLHCEFNTVDVKNKSIRKKGDIDYVYNADYNVEKKEGREIKSVQVKQRRRVSWIIDSNQAFDWGLQMDIPRPSKSEVRSTYHFYKVANKSMGKSVIPYADGFQLHWLKYNNAIAQARPSGLAIDISVLQNLKVGEKSMDALDIIAMSKQVGDMLIKSINHQTQQQMNFNGLPIKELIGGVGQFGKECIDGMERNYALTLRTLGLPDLSNPSGEMTNGVANTALEQGYGVISGYVQGMRMITESMATNVVLRYKVMSYFSEWQDVYPVIGQNMSQIVKLSNNLSTAEVGIFMEMRPDEKEKAEIMQLMQLAMKPDAGGNAAITLGDAFYIIRLLKKASGIKMAEMYIADKQQKYQKEAAEQANAREQNMGQVQQASAAAANDGKIKYMQAEYAEKAKLDYQNNVAKIIGDLVKIDAAGQNQSNVSSNAALLQLFSQAVGQNHEMNMSMLDKAHEAAMTGMGQQHEQNLQESQQGHEAEMQENEPEPATAE